jgi:hypothetical protein
MIDLEPRATGFLPGEFPLFREQTADFVDVVRVFDGEDDVEADHGGSRWWAGIRRYGNRIRAADKGTTPVGQAFQPDRIGRKSSNAARSGWKA